MKTDKLRLNQLSPAAYQRYLTYLHALDAKDLDAYGTYLAQDVSVQFNNQAPCRERHWCCKTWATTDKASGRWNTSW